MLDASTAGQLDRIFEKYAKGAKEIQLEDWHKRGWGHKLIDNAYYLINEIL